MDSPSLSFEVPMCAFGCLYVVEAVLTLYATNRNLLEMVMVALLTLAGLHAMKATGNTAQDLFPSVSKGERMKIYTVEKTK